MIESAGEINLCESLDISHVWWLVDGHGKDTILIEPVPGIRCVQQLVLVQILKQRVFYK